MSCDAFIFDPSEPLDAASAPESARLLGEVGRLPEALQESGRVGHFVDALVAIHPNLTGDGGDESPFASTIQVTHPAGLWLNLVWSAASSVRADIVRIALENELGVYDPQAGLTYNPTRVVAAPSTAVIGSPWLWGVVPAEGPLLRETVTLLSKKDRDAFCILERADGAFMQALHLDGETFRLEHRLARGGAQFEVAEGADAGLVETAIVSWAAEDSRWHELPWTQLAGP